MDEYPNTEKIQKVLARAGVASRRTIEEWILEGRVQINHSIAHIGDRVSVADVVQVDGKKISHEMSEQAGRRILIYHKPEGEVCTRTDPEGRPTVFDNLKELQGERWVVVGRLDINSSGLLLFTTDGDLANSLMHPSSKVEREYAVRVYGHVSEEGISNLKKGVMLEDGVAKFHSIVDVGGEGTNHWYHVLIKEGKKREVRRMWATQNVEVSRLMRIRFGPIKLSRDLKSGDWRELEVGEVDKLSESVGVKLKKRTGLYGRQKVRPDKTSHSSNAQCSDSNDSGSKGDQRRGYLRRRRT